MDGGHKNPDSGGSRVKTIRVNQGTRSTVPCPAERLGVRRTPVLISIDEDCRSRPFAAILNVFGIQVVLLSA